MDVTRDGDRAKTVGLKPALQISNRGLEEGRDNDLFLGIHRNGFTFVGLQTAPG